MIIHLVFLMLVFFPPLVAVCGAFLAFRLHWTRWLVHFVVITSVPVAPIFFVFIEGIVDPTTVDYPGPGEGLALLFYLLTAIPSLLGYLAFVVMDVVRTIQRRRS
jgi:hypothetical protein